MAQVKRIRRNVSGILILDKPRGMSSNQALQKVRWLLNAEKAGHTGSLDPLATGVLPLCFGEATKFSQYLLDADKGYETVTQLGVTTTTGDAEGEVVERREVTVGRDEIEALLPRFRGEIKQIPPMYSALKKDGQPLYKLARAGEVVEREARSVNIARLELLALDNAQLRLSVACSKGTYIRTLVEDIGRELGCGGHVAELRRTQAGPFALAQAVSLETLEQAHAEGGSEALDQLPAAFRQRPAALAAAAACPSTVRSTGCMGRRYVHRTRQNLAWSGYRITLRRFIGIGEVSEDGRIAPRRLHSVGMTEAAGRAIAEPHGTKGGCQQARSHLHSLKQGLSPACLPS